MSTFIQEHAGHELKLSRVVHNQNTWTVIVTGDGSLQVINEARPQLPDQPDYHYLFCHDCGLEEELEDLKYMGAGVFTLEVTQ